MNPLTQGRRKIEEFWSENYLRNVSVVVLLGGGTSAESDFNKECYRSVSGNLVADLKGKIITFLFGISYDLLDVGNLSNILHAVTG